MSSQEQEQLPLTPYHASTYPGANTNPGESDVYLAIRNVCQQRDRYPTCVEP